MYRSLCKKYIQLQAIPRRTKQLVLLMLVMLSTGVVVDRLTLKTMSDSRWARMMYEVNPSEEPLLAVNMDRPKDLHIAFVGDSVTRYMYIALVYFLRHNKWIQDDEYPNILNAKHYPSWNDHYNHSNLALVPHEECDCFRLNPQNSTRIDKEQTIENRYFSDPERNNYITFIEIFGGYTPHGHWNPDEVYKTHQMDFERLQSNPFVWREDWPGLIRNYLSKLDPKPEYLVFNEGLWIEHELGYESVRQSIKDALDETGIIGIYKTTTLPNINSGLAKRSAGVVFNRHDDDVCQLIGNCLDFSWTKDLGDDHYWDGVHFKPHVNRGMNIQLLDRLQKMKEGNFDATEETIA